MSCGTKNNRAMLILVRGGSLAQKIGKINYFDKSAKMEQKMIFSKFSKTPP